MWPVSSPAECFVARRARLSEALDGPAALFSGLPRVRNFEQNLYPFRAESHFLYLVGRHLEGAVLVFDGGQATLYAHEPDPDEALWTGAQTSLDELSEQCAIECRPIDDFEPLEAIAALPPQDADSAAWFADFLDREIVALSGDELEALDQPLADAMIQLRLYHDEAAQEQLRQAAHVTKLAHEAGRLATQAGKREAWVAARMRAEIVASGMDVAYAPIVTVRGEVLHNQKHDGLIAEGDLLLADVGAETPEGWAGDVTRVWPASGKFSATQRALYEVVLRAQKAAIAAVGPGVRYLDVHRVSGRTLLTGLGELGIVRGDAEELYNAGLAGLFYPHGVGHLLGLDVHDLDDLGDRASYAPGRSRLPGLGDRYLRLDRDLAPGMAVTIEPGFYQVPGLLENPETTAPFKDAIDFAELSKFSDVRGIRIEDDLLVTDSGAEVLSAEVPKEVEAILARD